MRSLSDSKMQSLENREESNANIERAVAAEADHRGVLKVSNPCVPGKGAAGRLDQPTIVPSWGRPIAGSGEELSAGDGRWQASRRYPHYISAWTLPLPLRPRPGRSLVGRWPKKRSGGEVQGAGNPPGKTSARRRPRGPSDLGGERTGPGPPSLGLSLEPGHTVWRRTTGFSVEGAGKAGEAQTAPGFLAEAGGCLRLPRHWICERCGSSRPL